LTRALLVCPEPLGNGQPAGIGIRFLEIANVLRADGHEVTLLSRDPGPLAVTPENLLRCSAEADVAIVQGHVANDFFAHARSVPTIVDLYDPFIIENLHYHEARGPEVFTHDHVTLMNSLARGDAFLCASEAQRFFYLGLLLAIGRVNPVAFEADPNFDGLVRLAPFGVQPPRPLPRRERNAARRARDAPAILFGGIYDWYDPLLAIDAVIRLRETKPEATLTFNTHPNPDLTPQSGAARAMRHVRERKAESFVHFAPWVPYDERGAFFDRFVLALLTFPQSIETALSMRTRVYDYLWGGLPIVTSSAPGTDEIVTRYGAGTIVPSSAADDYAAAMLRLLDGYEAAVAGTRRFVEEHQWRRTLAPLVELVRKPRFDATKEQFATAQQMPPARSSVLDRLKRKVRR
jgi:glycosyltransferase involved in cell wall biosynthesis